MQFCEEEIDWKSMLDGFVEIYDKVSKLEEIEPLQAIALAREAKEKIDEFIGIIQSVTLRSIVCTVLNNIELDEETSEILTYIQEMYRKFEEFDDAISAIKKDGFQSFEEIERAIEPLVGNFEDEKNLIKHKIDETIRSLFSPLVELGASQQDIDDAFEEVEFSDDPKQYIIDLFFKIAQNTIRNVD